MLLNYKTKEITKRDLELISEFTGLEEKDIYIKMLHHELSLYDNELMATMDLIESNSEYLKDLLLHDIKRFEGYENIAKYIVKNNINFTVLPNNKILFSTKVL